MFFSVVIPLYNKEQSVVKTLDCVLRQTYADYEVIIVNDGSTDESFRVVQEFINTRSLQSTWHVIDKGNGGVSSARNRGIMEAHADYIAFLDADDYWDPTYLAEQYQMILDFPDAVMLSTGWGYICNDQKKEIQHHPQNYRGYISDYWSQKKGTNIFFVCVCVIRRSVFHEIQPYDENMKYGEDLDMAYRIILNYNVAFNSKILGYYRQDAENRAMNKVIPLDSHLISYMDKYAIYRKNNDSFRRYFDTLCVSTAYPYLFHESTQKQAREIMRKCSVRDLKWSVKLMVYFPFLYRILLRYYKKIVKK